MKELQFKGTRISFGSGRHAVTAVEGVDLTVPGGKVVGLVGESGSGKSTLARAAAGLVPVDSGSILIDGEPIAGNLSNRPVQMVFQDPFSSLDPRMSTVDSVAESIPRNAVRGRRKRLGKATDMLARVGLDPVVTPGTPARLSGGQRQRVALARALVARPDVLIADEITSALDVSVQGTVLNLLRELHQEMKFSMLFISHNLAVIRYVSDFIAVMYRGRVVEFGGTSSVIAAPQHPYTKELLAAAPELGGAHFTEASEFDIVEQLVSSPDAGDRIAPGMGCTYHPRCPTGPLLHAERTVCRTQEPTGNGRVHTATCHFAAPLPRTQEEESHSRQEA